MARNDWGTPGGIGTSSDQGRTWTLPERLPFPVSTPFLLRTRGGVLLLAHRGPTTGLHYSLDDGRTWSETIVISQAGLAPMYMMELPDGKVYVVYSDDLGHTEFGVLARTFGQRLRVDGNGVHPEPWKLD